MPCRTCWKVLLLLQKNGPKKFNVHWNLYFFLSFVSASDYSMNLTANHHPSPRKTHVKNEHPYAETFETIRWSRRRVPIHQTLKIRFKLAADDSAFLTIVAFYLDADAPLSVWFVELSSWGASIYLLSGKNGIHGTSRPRTWVQFTSEINFKLFSYKNDSHRRRRYINATSSIYSQVR